MAESDSAEPPHASGWHSRGYLPHFDVPELVQTVVFRLADSLPQRLREERSAMAFRVNDDALDIGKGVCWLRQPAIAALAEEAMLHFDGERYFLLAWCIMPNHVHAMLELRPGFRLGDQVKSWKSYSARRANQLLKRSGAFWSVDYFDRFIRDERHYEAALAYIEGNPVKAGLAAQAEQWPWSSARRR